MPLLLKLSLIDVIMVMLTFLNYERSYVKILKKNISNFEFALSRAKTRQAAQEKEPFYVQRNLQSIIQHLRDIKNANPKITHDEMQTMLFDEIDKYSQCVFENSFVFTESMEYFCCRYLQAHKDKYDEISQKLQQTDTKSLNSFQECNNFDECLIYYVYNLKKEVFKVVLGDYIEESDENYKNLDDILHKNLRFYSKKFFGDHFELPEIADVLASDELSTIQKRVKIKEYSTWYRNPADRKRFLIFSNLFMNNSFSYLPYDQEALDQWLRDDLSHSTASLVENLDSLGHLDSYLVSYVNQMYEMGFPEYASVVCKNGMPNKQFIEKVKSYSHYQITQEIKEFIDPNRVKQLLSANVLSSKSIPLESLLALNTFWSNRYIKELSLYSESMFAVNEFGLIDKVLADEEIDISQDQIREMLIKMDTLYPSARAFVEKKQIEINQRESDNEKFFSNDIENKIVRYSYEPYFEKLRDSFGTAYASYFSKTLPNSKNDLTTDADWYVRLQNPIYASYGMKDESIKVILTNLGIFNTSELLNAGVILNNISDDGTFSNPSVQLGIGLDAGLSFPVRVHVRLDVIKDFLKSINGNAIVPIYEGADDFCNPITGKTLPAHIVLSMNDKQKTIIKKHQKAASSMANPNFVSHLCMIDSKHIPDHLKTEYLSPNKKIKKQFERRYIDLDSGVILSKVGDDYIPVKSKSQLKGGTDHGIE